MAPQERAARIQQAVKLIKAGNREAAYDILREVIVAEPNDWRGWWGLVHATSNAKERYIALQKTVELNPNHEKASALLKRAGARRSGASESGAAPTEPQVRTSELSPLGTTEITAAQNPFDAPSAADTVIAPINPFDASLPYQEQAPAEQVVPEPAPWDSPPEAPTQIAASDPAPWDNPFDGPPQAASSEAMPWDSPLDDPPQAVAAEPERWEDPFGLPSETASPESTPDPFAVVKSPQSQPDAWSRPVPLDRAKAKPSKSSGGSHILLNAAIAFVGVLAAVLIIALVLTQLDLGGAINGLLYGGAPNGLTGGDRYQTVGGGRLTVGESQRGTLTDLNDAHNWTFEGVAAQTVTITCVGLGATDPQMKLIDEFNNVLARDDDTGRDYGLGHWDAIIVYTLPTDGTYTIRVDVWQFGEYEVRVTTDGSVSSRLENSSSSPNDLTGGDGLRTVGGGWIAIGGNQRDTLNSLVEAHNWAFEGFSGETVTITVTGIGDSDPQFRLINSAGNVLAHDDDSGRSNGLGQWDAYVLVAGLPADDIYTIRVDMWRAGEYEVNVYAGEL